MFVKIIQEKDYFPIFVYQAITTMRHNKFKNLQEPYREFGVDDLQILFLPTQLPILF